MCVHSAVWLKEPDINRTGHLFLFQGVRHRRCLVRLVYMGVMYVCDVRSVCVCACVCVRVCSSVCLCVR